ncbi:VOC family protein [Robertkochia flava]|uniref:VOC family protein n=1 Tax=Robertkochia flava TaxID=3447986 RepID=UPI001CD00F8E|nr:VOC family protein [Robertkochia marina]
MKHFFITVFLGLLISAAHAQHAPALTFNHQALQVHNLDESAAFYQEVLGLTEIEDKTEQPHIRWFSMGSKLELHLIEDPSAPEAPVKGVHMALSTADLDGMMQHLKSKEIPFENWMGEAGTTNSRPDGVRQIYVQDPDGYWIEINGK